MDLLGIYYRLPVVLQHALISAYGLRLRYLRYGAEQRRITAALGERETWPTERLRELQLVELNRFLRIAGLTVPLYRERGVRAEPLRDLDELGQLPTVAKLDLQAPRERVTSSAYAGRRLLEVHTGGTTGTPLTIYCDRPALQRNFAFLARFREWVGAPIGERAAVLAGRTLVPPDATRPPYWRRNLASNTMLFSSYHISPSTIPDYAAALRRFRPAVIDSYPSSILPIARWLLDQGIRDIRPRAIVTSSETLDAAPRAAIEEAFGCRVYDAYGAAEMAAWIIQCEQGRYHVHPEYGIVELIADGRPVGPGETGEIVATGFVNPVMPLIRYATGDLAVASAERCPCGRTFPVIERVEGRRDEVLVTPEGRFIGRLDPIFKAITSVYESQIVQDRVDHVRVELVTREGYSPQEERTLLDGLRKRLGPTMHIDIVRVDAIARTRGGKLRSVVSLLPRERPGVPA